MAITILTAKVIGTMTIGLWAGSSMSLSAEFCPAACQLSEQTRQKYRLFRAFEAPGTPSLARVREGLLGSIHVSLLSAVSSATLLFSYIFADRFARHPYLLYAALGAPLVGALQFFGACKLCEQVEGLPGSELSTVTETVYEEIHASDIEKTTSISEATFLQKYDIYSLAVAGLTSSLFLLTIVGLAGESYKP